MIPNDATAAQIGAADPGTSTWLAANAGSGKTRVLTDRVARLLLEGVEPQRILCLTYTRAAASEMQNRLFSRLGSWTMLPDARLSQELDDLGLPVPDNTEERRRRARTLFAQAIETPGGLKIQTIHSFCAALLRRFPLEAGVSPGFTELDERSAGQLRAEVLDALADGEGRDALDAVAPYLAGDDALDGLVSSILKHRVGFGSGVDRDRILAALGLAPGFTADQWPQIVFDGSEPGWIPDAIAALASESAGVAAAVSGLLARIASGARDEMLFEDMVNTFLYAQGGAQALEPKTGSVPNKKFQQANAELTAEIHALMARVAEAHAARHALACVARTEALHRFAGALLPALDAAKATRAWLDFDDLVTRARALLDDPGVAQWVLFRLDGGIDHILVDEAQDTSPDQWEIVRHLAREFSAGLGARPDVRRTLFVVGDPKQSIYSFQGADPGGFDLMRDHFATAQRAAGEPFQETALHYSFRSAPAILRAVDETFVQAAHRGLGMPSEHIAFHGQMPGRVDLWPVIAKSDPEPDLDFDSPVDALPQTSPKLVLARRVVDAMRAMLDEGTQITTSKGITRPIHAGDFLILVQRRDPLFHELIRACKEADLPIAGADRMRIGAELAVKDLVALLSFLATPEDSLSLAAALRSPLLGWSEAELYRLAHGRGDGVHLWQTLRERRDEHPSTLAILDDLRARADFLRPYEILDRILTRHGGRSRLLARLGGEAEDGIDALLGQALAFERAAVPDLTGFLGSLAQDSDELKRPLDSQSRAIRIMTVHGAKGLESPIVILPDSAQRKAPSDQTIVTLDGGLPVWGISRRFAPPPLLAALDAQRALQLEERMRLLYVAMTRAESWLIVAAAGDGGAGDEETEPTGWHGMIEAGLTALGALPLDVAGETGLRWQGGDWPAAIGTRPDDAPAAPAEPAPLPDWALVPVVAPADVPIPRSPSDLGGEKALPGSPDALDPDRAMQRGTALHWLLEHLPNRPRADWPAIAAQCPDATADVLAEAKAVLDEPGLAQVFAPGTLAEIALSARLDLFGGALFQGTIDRLILDGDSVLIVDFKSNALVPERVEEIPEGLLRQLGAYVAMAADIWPGHRIRSAILWTRAARLMEVPAELTANGLRRAAAP